MKTLVVGSNGFIGYHLMRELRADEMDISLGSDVRYGIDGKYKTIIWLACNQANTHAAYKENIAMYQALDDYRRKYPKTHLIFISSAAVYDRLSIYAQSKVIGEVYAWRFARHTILRLSNVYGHGDGHGAPDRFLRGEKMIHGDGEQIRDLISVETVVSKILAFIQEERCGIYNISSGRGTTVNQMFKLFGEGKPKYDAKHPIGVKFSVLKPGYIND